MPLTSPRVTAEIINRPLQEWSLSQLVTEVEADYSEGKQLRFDVLSELIFRAGANETNR